MAKLKGVAQLVKSLLKNPETKGFPCTNGIEAFRQSAGGYDACFSAELCFPVNMGQDRNEKVNPGNRQYADCPIRGLAGKSL